jgi:hypothetical protein
LPDIPLCVSESQAPFYREAHPAQELIVHPDDVVGIAPKRQWLLDRHPKVMMFDDDLLAMLDLSVPPGEEARVLDPQRVRDLVARLFDVGEEMGAYLVGFSSYADPALYRPHRPFALTGFVSGYCLGMRRSPKVKLPYPHAPWLLTDDLYVSALNAHAHRLIFQDLRYGFSAKDTWTGAGGMATHRTWDRVVENERRLKELFGDAVRRRGNTGRSTLTVEIQLTLKVPW